MNRIIATVMALTALSGCTSVQYNGNQSHVKDVNYPEIGTIVTAYVGDHMVQKGKITEEKVLVVDNMIDGALYSIPAKTYLQIGYDNLQDFYSASGVTRGFLADPINALSLVRRNNAELCVVTTFGGSSCYKGDFHRESRLSERGNNFQQTLLYSGRIGDKINISYREFSNKTARPAFNNDVEYDLSSSKRIGYKGAVIDVIKADNSSITYKVVRNFL